jgi:hypothetical protein
MRMCLVFQLPPSLADAQAGGIVEPCGYTRWKSILLLALCPEDVPETKRLIRSSRAYCGPVGGRGEVEYAGRVSFELLYLGH